MQDLLTNPDDADVEAAFRVQLKKSLQRDAGFAQALIQLLDEAQAQTSHGAEASGGSAIARGPAAKSVGKGGILIEGGVKGDFNANDIDE